MKLNSKKELNVLIYICVNVRMKFQVVQKNYKRVSEEPFIFILIVEWILNLYISANLIL